MPTTEQRQSSQFHARRPPAHRSVSLRHSPPKVASSPTIQNLKSAAAAAPSASNTSMQTETNSNSNIDSNTSNSNSDGSPSSLRPLNGRGSSGESSNADTWFNQSNNQVMEASTSYADNDPPFFMRNGSSSESPPDGQAQRHRQYLGLDGGAQSLPVRSGMVRTGTDGESSDDFRGVIDDLTIENKKLKRRLKKYEKLHDAHLKDDKLFEIRVHGLEADKKRELEEILRTFAAGLAPQPAPAPAFPPNGYAGISPGLKTHQTGSSQASAQNTDSAYASMSASGQGSSAPSSGASKHKRNAQAAKSRQQNIHSFLHHIPEGLQPHPNSEEMSERAKEKMVVRRLEQIFAGTDALAGPHHQTLQQEDVSQNAARADRTAIEAQGQQALLEGHREADMMNTETEDPLDIGAKRRQAAENTNTGTLNHQESENIAEQDFAESSSSDSKSDEQRPTRPLDLDPDRAQVPADNYRYIRHLGFSPQDPEHQRTPEDGHGWIYLNLLINMAQLHTIHVTPEFVRKAVTERSDHFEVSEDGRKVRWRGGSRITKTSSYGGDSSRERTDDDSQSPRKRLKISNGNGVRATSQRGSGASIRKPQPDFGRLMYTPLFSHRSMSEDSEASSSTGGEYEDSPYTQQMGGESSGMTSSGLPTSAPKKKKKHDNGPIIFYNNARFCTDLSGDSGTRGGNGAPNYKPSSLAPVGRTPPREEPSQMFEKRGPLEEASLLPEPMDIADNPIPESLELAFPPQSPPNKAGSAQKRPHIDLEVTGMGGVYPADNFAIEVESRHAVVDQVEAPAIPIQDTTKNLPDRFARILHGNTPQRKIRAAVAQRYLKIERIEHPPSMLPPALCFVPEEDDSTSDDYSGTVDEMSMSPDAADQFPPSTAPQTMYMPDVVDSDDSDEEMEDEEYDESDAESDGSLDLLATAREADPEAISRKERQYDAEMAERLAEEIPAGSSAATAGGGSGFASPESGVDKRQYRKAMEDARQRAKLQVPAVPATLQRANNSDSMDVQGVPGSTSSSDVEDEDEDEEEDDDDGDDDGSGS